MPYAAGKKPSECGENAKNFEELLFVLNPLLMTLNWSMPLYLTLCDDLELEHAIGVILLFESTFPLLIIHYTGLWAKY